MSLEKKILAGLNSLMCGDALGVLAVGYNKKTLKENYNKVPLVLENPIPSSKERTKWNFGEVTDDTFQTLVVSEVLIENKKINKNALVKKFIDLPEKYNKLDSSTGALRKNCSPWIDRFSIGSGAAMRVSPIGMVFSVKNEELLLNNILMLTQLTHNSKSAVAGAAAIAFAISGILDGYKEDKVIEYAIKGAEIAQKYGEDDGLPIMFKEIERACNVGCLKYRENNFYDCNFGFKSIEAVPFALALANEFWNASKGIRKAIEYGGDADTIGSMVGVLCGTHSPETVPDDILLNINSLNKNVEDICIKLAKLRYDNLNNNF